MLSAMDRAAANLAKLDAVWERASPHIPSSPQAGTTPEYEDLCRTWTDLLTGLPPIDGWTVTEQLPDIDAAGRAFIDYLEIGEPPFGLLNELEIPGRELDEYRFKLGRARKRAVRSHLENLVAVVGQTVDAIVDSLTEGQADKITNERVTVVRNGIDAIERLLGDSSARHGRWGYLKRHLHFSEPQDWRDIKEFDWPSVRSDIDAATFADTEPVPVPELDLGLASRGELTGSATISLKWGTLDDVSFERLLYDLLRSFPEHKNVQWLTNTNAPDRGRDISMDRIIESGTGLLRTERVIIQAKHWQKRSVAPVDLASVVTIVKLWEPPVVHGLIIATSGRFTSDAVAWIENHNRSGQPPFIEMWPESRLETLLARKSYIAAAHGLR